MRKEEIKKLLDKRDKILKADPQEADSIESNITKAFKANYLDYEVDFIIESLTRFGQAPSLVYDDNGLFQVSSVGFNQAVSGDQRIEEPMTIFVETEAWFPTIREALLHYLNDRN